MPAPSMTEGLEVLVQLVIAAITTAPSSRSNSWPSSDTLALAWGTSSTATEPWSCAGRPSSSPSSWPAIEAGGSLAGKD
jgi:hypothetical protein